MNAPYPKVTPVSRLAWIAAFGVLLALLALLLGATAASAAPPPATADAQQTLEEEEEREEGEEEAEEAAEEEELEAEEEAGWEEEGWGWEEEGWEAEELGGTDCELGEEALEEGLLTLTDVQDLCAAEEEWEEEMEGRSPRRGDARPSCALRSARARVATGRNRLKLFIGYAAATPTRARIEVRAGKRKLATIERKLGRRGVIRLNRRVGKRLGRQLRKRGGGKRVKLRIKLPPAAAACPSHRLVLFAR